MGGMWRIFSSGGLRLNLFIDTRPKRCTLHTYALCILIMEAEAGFIAMQPLWYLLRGKNVKEEKFISILLTLTMFASALECFCFKKNVVRVIICKCVELYIQTLIRSPLSKAVWYIRQWTSSGQTCIQIQFFILLPKREATAYAPEGNARCAREWV